MSSEQVKIGKRYGGEHIENAGDLILAGQSLGTQTLEHDGRILLVPTPSNDPNDPLNFSHWYKIYLVCVLCIAVFLSNFLAAGPTVAIVSIAIDFTGPPPTMDIPKTAYLFTTSALFQGAGLFIWSPIQAKYGRRPCYLAANIGFLLCAVWAGVATKFDQELAARIGIGFFSGGAEALAPITIGDMFFVHERGTYLAFYQTFLSSGVGVGIIFSGLIVDGTGNWRVIYYVAAAAVGAATLLVFFTMPETAYRRTSVDRGHVYLDERRKTPSLEHQGEKGSLEQQSSVDSIPKKKTYIQSLALTSGTHTQESIFKIFARPFAMILLPAVGWSMMVFSVTIGFYVAISSNFAVALGSPPYNFTPVQSGLCFVSAVVGSIIAIPCGGPLGDWVAARATHRNNGIRHPEQRLPALLPIIIFAPLSLVLYGVGIDRQLHWMVPTLGLGMLSFALCAGSNIALMYCLDCYKPIASEVVVAVLGWKGIVGFGLSFSTNSWVAVSGYAGAFGEMAAISGFFLLFTLVFIYWGAAIRQASFKWKLTSWLKWDADRDDLQVVMH